MKKILIYSHDTFGLGNIRRMTEIAKHLVERDPDASVLIITGSPMLHAFRIPPRIDYVKLPCLARTRGGDYTVKFLSMHYQDTLQLRANLIRSTVLDFRPDLILVDKKPLGVGNELAPTLEMLDRRADGPKIALVLRDILDSPEQTIPVWRKNGYFEAIEAFYDSVLVVGTADVYDVRREYAFPAPAAAKVKFCGYMARGEGRRSRAQARAELGVGDAPLVVVCAGGGADGFELISTYLRGAAVEPPAPGTRSLIVCGPEMSAAERATLKDAERGSPDVSVIDFCDDMLGLIAAADVVVAMGGYNTVCEILSQRKRAVIVPRVVPVAEQGIRAERMSRLGLFTTLHPKQLEASRLIAAVRAELDRENVVPLERLDMQGLPRMATIIDGLLSERARPVDGEYQWTPRQSRQARVALV